jgi:hypothetical protein
MTFVNLIIWLKHPMKIKKKNIKNQWLEKKMNVCQFNKKIPFKYF